MPKRRRDQHTYKHLFQDPLLPEILVNDDVKKQQVVGEYEGSDDYEVASERWRLWLRKLFSTLVDRDSANIIISYGFIVCQWCEEMEGAMQNPWHLKPNAHLLAELQLCPEDLNSNDALVCRRCARKCDKDKCYDDCLYICSLCDRLVGMNCCAQIVWCQSHNCICTSCTMTNWVKLTCDHCHCQRQASQFEQIRLGLQICEDATVHSLRCDTCYQID